MKGTIKWFNAKNGYGFIAGEDGKDYFAHVSALPEGAQPKDGEAVNFEGAEGDRGPIAQNITFGDAPAAADSAEDEEE